MKKFELTESGKRKLEEALRRHYEREARVEDSLKEYATKGIYNTLKEYQQIDPENPRDCIISEEGVFGELVYLRVIRLNRETGIISQEFFVDMSNINNIEESFEDEEKGV